MIQFLVVNEQSLRGTFCTEIEKERGFFKNIFEYTMKKTINYKVLLVQYLEMQVTRPPKFKMK